MDTEDQVTAILKDMPSEVFTADLSSEAGDSLHSSKNRFMGPSAEAIKKTGAYLFFCMCFVGVCWMRCSCIIYK